MRAFPDRRGRVRSLLLTALVPLLCSLTVPARAADHCDGLRGKAALAEGLTRFQSRDDRWLSAKSCFVVAAEGPGGSALYMLGMWHARNQEPELALGVWESAIEPATEEERATIRHAIVKLVIKQLGGTTDDPARSASLLARAYAQATPAEQAELDPIQQPLFVELTRQAQSCGTSWDCQQSLWGRARVLARTPEQQAWAESLRSWLFRQAVECVQSSSIPYTRRWGCLQETRSVSSSSAADQGELTRLQAQLEAEVSPPASSAPSSPAVHHSAPGRPPRVQAPAPEPSFVPAPSKPWRTKGFLRYFGVGLAMLGDGPDRVGAVIPLQAGVQVENVRLGAVVDAFILSNHDSPSGTDVGTVEGSSTFGAFLGASVGLASYRKDSAYLDLLFGVTRFESRCFAWSESGPNEEDPSQIDYGCDAEASGLSGQGVGLRLGYATRSMFDLGATLYYATGLEPSFSVYLGFKPDR